MFYELVLFVLSVQFVDCLDESNEKLVEFALGGLCNLVNGKHERYGFTTIVLFVLILSTV